MATRILVVLTIALYAGAAARSLSKRQSRSVAASDEFYVLANKNELLRVDVGLGSAAQKLQSINEGVVAIDYDAKSEQLFFCNNKTNKIYKTGIQTGDAVGVIVEKDSSQTYRKSMELQAIAVDWVAKKLYWINDKEGRLVRCDFDGTNDVQIKKHDDLKKVESMVIVPGVTTVLYLARAKAIGKIEITESNGKLSSSLTSSLKGFNDGPAGLAIDHATERLYWFDSKDKSSINSFKPTDQSIKKDAFSSVGSPVAIAVRQSIVVWVDEGNNAYIRTVNTTQANTKSTKHSSVTKLGTGISAMAAYSKVTQQVSSDATTAPPLATTVSTTSRSPTSQPVTTQKAMTDSAMTSESSATTTSGPTTDGATSAPLPVSTQEMPSTEGIRTTSISATTKSIQPTTISTTQLSSSTTDSPVSTQETPTTVESSTKGMSTTSMATTSSQLTSTTESPVSATASPVVSTQGIPTIVKSTKGISTTSIAATTSSQPTLSSTTASPVSKTQAAPSTSTSADVSTTSKTTEESHSTSATTVVTTTQGMSSTTKKPIVSTTQSVSPTSTTANIVTIQSESATTKTPVVLATQKASPTTEKSETRAVTTASPQDPTRRVDVVESTESEATEKVEPLSCECQNEGTCVRVGEETECLCPEGYAGEVCEECVEPEKCLTNLINGGGPEAINDNEKESDKGGLFMYIGIGVGVLVVVVVVIVVVFVVVRRRSKTLNYEPDQVNEGSSSKFCNPIYDSSAGVGGRRAANFRPASFDNSIYNKSGSPWPKSSHDSDGDNDYQDPDEFCSKAPVKETPSDLANPFFLTGAAGGSTTDDNGSAKSNHDDPDCNNDYQDPDEFCSKAPMCPADEKNSKGSHSGFVNPFFVSDAAGGSSNDYLTSENLYDNGPETAKSSKTPKADAKSEYLTPEENPYDNKGTSDQKSQAKESSDDYLAPAACTPFNLAASGPKPMESEDYLEPTTP